MMHGVPHSNPNLQVLGVIKVEQQWAVLPTEPTILCLWEDYLVLGTQIVLLSSDHILLLH